MTTPFTLAELDWAPDFLRQVELDELTTCNPCRIAAVHRSIRCHVSIAIIAIGLIPSFWRRLGFGRRLRLERTRPPYRSTARGDNA